jgi:hypothetical protein
LFKRRLFAVVLRDGEEVARLRRTAFPLKRCIMGARE